ncbi:MAG: aminoacyl-tRNA hydrolase [Candidatus Peregrinibacteria bacterium]
MRPSFVIIGLGNPGASYGKTRHNAGFRALDRVNDIVGGTMMKDSKKFLSVVCDAEIGSVPVLLVKPQTFMNRSGEAVKKIMDFYKLDAAKQLLVLCDDIDLPLGELRLRASGGPGTHNGLKSIVEVIGEGFPRLRIGLGAQPAGVDLAAWVLSVPPKEDAEILEAALEKVPGVVEEVVAKV